MELLHLVDPAVSQNISSGFVNMHFPVSKTKKRKTNLMLML